MQGWVKLHRKLLDNPVACRDSDYLAVWILLLLEATHDEIPKVFKGKKIILKPGQLITGRKHISQKLVIGESKVQRILSCYESEHQIEQQTSNKNRLISIVKWDEYQQSEQQNETQMNNKRTTDEQPVNTYKNVKNDKNVKNNKPPNPLAQFSFSPEVESAISEWLSYKAERGQSYKPRGLNTLIKKIKENVELHGDTAVVANIDRSISNNWAGLFWDNIGTGSARQSAKMTSDILDEIIRKEQENEQIGNSDAD